MDFFLKPGASGTKNDAAAAKAARVTRIHKTVITPVWPPLSATLPSMGETTPPTLEARPMVMPEARPKWLGTNFWPKATDGLKAILRETAAGTSMKVTKAGLRDMVIMARQGIRQTRPVRITLLKPTLSARRPPISVAMAPEMEIIVVTEPERASDCISMLRKNRGMKVFMHMVMVERKKLKFSKW